MNCIIATARKSSACALIVLCLVSQSLAVEPIGYAWPKDNLLIPDKTPAPFQRVFVGDTYTLVKTINASDMGVSKLRSENSNLESSIFQSRTIGTPTAGRESQNWFIEMARQESTEGYLVICRGIEGSQRIGLMPFRDRLGNPTCRQLGQNTITMSSDVVELRPGYFPFQAKQRYPVLSRGNQNLEMLFSFDTFTQVVSVAEADVNFMVMADYSKTLGAIVQNLKSMADNALKEGRFGTVGDVFRSYDGDLAEDTASIRAELASEYTKRAEEQMRATQEKAKEQARAAQEQAEAEQKRYEAKQIAKGYIKYDGQWLTAQEIQQRKEEEKRPALKLRYAKSCNFIRRATALLDRNRGFDREALEKLLDAESKYKTAYEGIRTGDLKVDEAEHFQLLADNVWANVFTKKPMCGYTYNKVFRDEVIVPVDFGMFGNNGACYVQIGEGDRKKIATISGKNLRSIVDGLRKSEEWAGERSLILLENPARDVVSTAGPAIGDWDSVHLEFVPEKDGLDGYVELTTSGTSVKLNMLNVHCLLVRMTNARQIAEDKLHLETVASPDRTLETPEQRGQRLATAQVETSVFASTNSLQVILMSVTRQPFNQLFKSYSYDAQKSEGYNFQINFQFRARTFFVRAVGDLIRDRYEDTVYRLVKFERKSTTVDDPSVGGKREKDVSEVTVQHAGENPVVLVYLQDTEEQEPVAKVRCEAAAVDREYRRGQQIICNGRIYRVGDIDPKQMVIVDVQTGEQYVIKPQQ